MAQGAALRDDNRQIATIVQNLLGTSPIYLTGVNLTSANALHVAMVDGTGAQITAFGGVAQADNSTFTAGTTQGTPALAFYHSTIDTVTDGRAAALAIDNKRNLFTVIRDAAGNARGLNISSGGNISIDSIGTSIVPGTGATNLGKAEDAAHTTGDVGVMALAVRNDSGAVLAGTDGDYVPITTDATGAVRIDMNGTVSTNNSTTATLLANAVFTGTSEDVLNYNEIRITVIASHASASDGLSIQQSSDNSNWDITDTYTIPATTGKTYSVPRQARYFRIVYTNGGINQTSFRLQVILNRLGSQASSQRPSDVYTNETDLEQNQTFGMLYNGSTWDRQREIVNATNTIGTGITAVGLLAQFDDVAPTSVTENSFGNVRMSANRNLYGTIRDAAGNERGANVNASSQLTTVDAASSATGSAPPTNAIYIGLSDGTNLVGVARAAANTNSSGIGQLPAAIMGSFDDTSPTAITENNLGSIRISANRNLYSTIRDAAGNERGLNVSAGGNISVDTVTTLTGTTTLTPGTGATNLGKAEDAAHTTGDTGVMALAVRNDAVAAFSGTDADYTPLGVDSNGTLHVVQKGTTGTLSNVAASATNVTLLAANNARIGAEITNDSSSLLYIKFGATASTSSYTVVLAGAASAPFSYYEVPAGYTGKIDGIWASATGNARVTEVTP